MAITDYERLRFYESLSEWGSRDIDRALEVVQEVGLSPEDLSEEVERCTNGDLGEQKLKDVDVCYVAYETILQNARNKISEVLNGFDFLNDLDGSIYTAGNYLCTSYDWDEDDLNKLKDKISKSSADEKEELKEDKQTLWFLDQLEIEDCLN